ncbi:MAG TPA: LuxR C-terminal-related transcriptional regulator, partial [Solimonas sp.]|nr:LuxR C-terminal-related transcriptional regulator [Solimonas sp.]
MQEHSPSEPDRLIQSFYSLAFELDWRRFRVEALQQFCDWTGASSAAWLTRGGSELPGEYAEWPSGAGVPQSEIVSLRFPEGRRWLEWPVLPRELQGTGGAVGGRALKIAHRGTPLHSTLLLRLPQAPRVDEETLRRVAGHLAQAATLSLRQFILRDEWLQAMDRASRGSAALVDERGGIYVCSPRFAELLGMPELSILPFPLPAELFATGQARFVLGELHFRANREGNLVLLHARRPHPLDVLSTREQQIARALAQGKTFKSVARECDIAISTVA